MRKPLTIGQMVVWNLEQAIEQVDATPFLTVEEAMILLKMSEDITAFTARLYKKSHVPVADMEDKPHAK